MYDFSLICEKTKKQIWIGQGNKSLLMKIFFSEDKQIMENLKTFLNEHIDQEIKLVCDEYEDLTDYEEY